MICQINVYFEINNQNDSSKSYFHRVAFNCRLIENASPAKSNAGYIDKLIGVELIS